MSQPSSVSQRRISPAAVALTILAVIVVALVSAAGFTPICSGLASWATRGSL
jgi:hypothetical protein